MKIHKCPIVNIIEKGHLFKRETSRLKDNLVSSVLAI